MKKRNKIKAILTVLFLTGLAVFPLSRMPFHSDMNHTIQANVYENGELTEKTTLVVSGSKRNYLFKDHQRFVGSLCIQAYERTCRDDMNVSIEWGHSARGEQIITYMQNGTFPTLHLRPKLLVDQTMTQFALGFKDGIVIATSDQMYQRYSNHYTSTNTKGL